MARRRKNEGAKNRKGIFLLAAAAVASALIGIYLLGGKKDKTQPLAEKKPTKGVPRYSKSRVYLESAKESAKNNWALEDKAAQERETSIVQKYSTFAYLTLAFCKYREKVNDDIKYLDSLTEEYIERNEADYFAYVCFLIAEIAIVNNVREFFTLDLYITGERETVFNLFIKDALKSISDSFDYFKETYGSIKKDFIESLKILKEDACKNTLRLRNSNKNYFVDAEWMKAMTIFEAKKHLLRIAPDAAN